MQAIDEKQRGRDEKGLFGSAAGWVLMGFLGIGGFYLISEHWAHLIGFLPWILLLACPLLHMFMHRGHGGHGGHGNG